MNFDVSNTKWVNQPKSFEIKDQHVCIQTDPYTDFWQRSYYGFRNDNAPALLLESDSNFTFTVKTSFVYQAQFDQCGVIIYLDSKNWFKASIEYENDEMSRLGSVVTNHGYSDWATTDIKTSTEMWYRLSRRGPDFLIESAVDGRYFRQMRIFHLHLLGETTAEMGKSDPPAPATKAVQFGLYACSPLESSFEATFSQFELSDSIWLAYSA